MRFPLDIFLGLRYLRPKRSFVSLITLLSMAGPAVGVAVLVVVTSVMSGFDRNIRQKLLGLQSHIHAYPLYNASDFSRRVTPNPGPAIEAMEEAGLQATPRIKALSLIQRQNQIQVKSIIGILPEKEKRVTELHANIVRGTYDIGEGEALIGEQMAQKIGLGVGDELLLHSPQKLTESVEWGEDGEITVKQPDTVYLPQKVRVAGIFSIGVYEMDKSIVYMHLDQAADLAGVDWGSATVINGKANNPFKIAPIKNKLEEKLPRYRITTWRDENARFFNALQVEKTLIMFVLFFIVIVAAFCIAGTLITVVTQKTREIGLLKAVGVSRFEISRIFLLQGAGIGFVGTAVGLALGLTIVHYRAPVSEFIALIMGREIFPEELYHLEKIPAWVSAGDITLIGGLSFLICLFAAVIPALYAAMLSPSRALQDEN